MQKVRLHSRGRPQETEGNFRWLTGGGLRITSEALIVAAQAQAPATRNILAKIHHTADSPKCRQYKHKRWDHSTHRQRMWVDPLCPVWKIWLRKIRTLVATWGGLSYRKREKQTHRSCRPGIVLVDKTADTIKIIDIAWPWDANIEDKYREKIPFHWL